MRRYTIQILIVNVAIATLLFLGCSQHSKKDVILNVGELTYTKQELDEQVRLRIDLLQNRKPIRDEKKLQSAERSIRLAILRSRMLEMFFLNVAKNLSPQESTVEHKWNTFYNSFRGNIKSQGEFKVLLKKNGYWNECQKLIREKAQVEQFVRDNCTSSLIISSNLVHDTIASMHRGNEIANHTNQLIYALASNIWKRAASGEDFAKMADAYNQDVPANKGGDLGENCDYNDFKQNDIEIWQEVSSLKAGDVTPPLDTDEGLVIYKCYDKVADEGYAGGYRFHLARIRLARALLYENFDFGYVKKELEKEAWSKATKEVFKKYCSNLKIDYPNGGNDLPKNFAKYADKIISEMKK